MAFDPQKAEIFFGGPEQYKAGYGDYDEVVFTPPTTTPDVIYDDEISQGPVWSLAENTGLPSVE